MASRAFAEIFAAASSHDKSHVYVREEFTSAEQKFPFQFVDSTGAFC